MTLTIGRLPLALILATLLAGGCSKKTNTGAAPADATVTSVTEGGGAAAGGTPLPKMDYWNSVTRYLVGTHPGSCIRSGETAKKSHKLEIDGAGKYKVDTHTGDLRATENAYFTRKRDPDGTYKLLFGANWPDMMLGLQLGDNAPGAMTGFGGGNASMNGCDTTALPISPAKIPLYQSFDSLFPAAPQALKCVEDKDMKMAPRTFQRTIGVFTLGDEKFDLTGRDEAVTFNKGFTTFSYTATAADGSAISATFDEHGRILGVLGSRNGQMFNCQR